MKKLIFGIFIFSAAAVSVSAQKKLNQRPVFVEWENNPVIHPVPPEYNSEPAYFILNDLDLDYRYEGRSINLYFTLHRIIKVLDVKGVESFNKIVIPVDQGTRVPSIKARTILPDGRVNDIAKDMIKVSKDRQGRYEILIAMEGVTRNAEVEVLVKEIRPGSMFGSYSFQYPLPVQYTRFSLSCPKDMVLEEKGYNGFPDVSDVVANNRRHISVSLSDIPALHEEPHSFYDLYAMRTEYRIVNFLDNNDNNKKKLYTWNDMGRKLYDEHCKITDKERAAVNKYLTSLGVVTNGNEFENIKKIENGIKSNIVLYSYVNGKNADEIDSIIENKAATASGYIKLFSACFNQAGVKNELGITGNRSEHTLDAKFENWDNMENYVFYFPKSKKFLSPTSVLYRYPFVPDELLTTKGVFCAIPPNGITIAGLSEIKTISPLGPSDSRKTTTANVSFTEDMEAMTDVTYTYSGYAAADIREELAVLPQENEKDWVRKMLPLYQRPEDILKYTIANKGIDNFYTNKPLEISASLNTPQLVDIAGSKFLFKVGEVIGIQDELYSKKERKLPVDLLYPNTQTRTITVNLPKGCHVLNPEALRINADYADRNVNSVIGFKSDYTLTPDKKNGDILVITINEFYSQIHFSVNEYEQYRKVFNAAADFNKVTLILEQKEKVADKAKVKNPKLKAKSA
jgi:hypothetical protein